MKVAKFGGSSVKDALSMRRCAEIVTKDSSLGLVIISATYNTTNQLEEICRCFPNKQSEANSLTSQLVERHLSLAHELELSEKQIFQYRRELEKLDTSLNHLRSEEAISPELKDLILSWGEKVSSFLFYSTLKNMMENDRRVSWIDACDYIATDSTFGIASAITEQIKIKCESTLRERFDEGELFITQGFIGRDERGRITTLGREGSDYSAALFAEALEAQEVQIWTDVDGIYQCDPNLIPEAKKIPFMSYDQATTMAKSGAKVLFGKTLAPLRSLAIPVYVKSSTRPDVEGTLISEKPFLGEELLSVTAKKRSDGVIITLIGNDLDQIEIEQSEIDRGDCFRSFFIPDKDEQEALELWFSRYFISYS